MKKIYSLFILLGLLFATAQCTITKRTFRKGYHIEWHKKTKSHEKQEKVEQTHIDMQSDEMSNEETISLETFESDSSVILNSVEDLPEKNTETKQTEYKSKTPSNRNVVNNLEAMHQKAKEVVMEELIVETENKGISFWRVLALIILGILYLVLSIPLFLVGFIAGTVISDNNFINSKYLSLILGLLAAFSIYWMTGFMLMVVFFTNPLKDRSVVRKQIIAMLFVSLALAIAATVFLFFLIGF